MIVMALRQQDYVASSTRQLEGSPSGAPEIERRCTAKNMAANQATAPDRRPLAVQKEHERTRSGGGR